jgi:two-component system response regulator HydG
MEHILFVDDDDAACALVSQGLEAAGFRVTTTTSPHEALDQIASEDFAVVVTDLGMSEMHGIELCRRVQEIRPDLPVVVLTGQGSLETAVAALRAGAYDFTTKPVDLQVLAHAISRAANERRLQQELLRLRQGGSAIGHGGIVGKSPAMRKVYELVERVAPSDASILVHGETGTGKERIARALHDASGRKGPFVAINCAALPATLLESELFGHTRGAFTDARSERRGLFLEAHGGTLFLDEIGELPLELQPKLLRALQERTVRPVGSNQEIPFDARLVTATNRDLETDVYDKRFREDLYYRIHVVRIDLPPLRARGADVLDLASYFLEKFARRSGKAVASLSPQAAEKLLAYDFPGNVRELENCMERAIALARFNAVTADDLPEKIQRHVPDQFVVAIDETTEILPVEELEKRYIRRVIKVCGGNKSKAAVLLGVDRRTLYRKLERYDAEDLFRAEKRKHFEHPEKEEHSSNALGAASAS